MPGQRQTRNIKKRPTRTRKRTQESRLVSSVITSLTLKSAHKKVEVYPIPLNNLVSRSCIGADADIKGLSYRIRIKFATGNNTNTVSANLGISGVWTERGPSTDTFNQQFMMKDVSYKGVVTFAKRLPHHERQFLNPDIATNFINLKIQDVCGVVKGCTIQIKSTFYFTRPAAATTVMGANDPAVDLYTDQDVNSGAVVPPSAQQDIPAVIRLGTSILYTTTSVASPYQYTDGSSIAYTITVAGTVNKVGEFLNTYSGASALQAGYSADGFEGRITT